MIEKDIERRFVFAADLAREAGRCAVRYFRDRSLAVTMKGQNDPVTAADLETDQLIARRIAGQFPEDRILSEESGGNPADRLWIVDPIDGTLNFARGISRFAVSIAFFWNGTVVLGAIYDPIADEMFTARRGGGAFLNGSPIRASAISEPKSALVEAGYSLKRPLADYHALVGRLLEAGYNVRQVGSAALGLAEVACGRIDGYCELHLASWDVAAGLVLVEEAGGRTSDFFTDTGLTDGNFLVAAAPALQAHLHEVAERER